MENHISRVMKKVKSKQVKVKKLDLTHDKEVKVFS